MNKDRITWRPDGGYKPNSPYSGDNPHYIFRGLNQIVKGNGSVLFTESWRGIEAVTGETPAYTSLTGTVATTSASTTVTGTTTKFTEELIVGQTVLIKNQLYQVRNIASNTSMTISPSAGSTDSGLTAKLPHLVMDVDFMKGTMARGSLQRFPQGTLLSVGQGAVNLYNNGASIISSLTASKRLQISIYDTSAGTYTHYKAGMATPTLVTVAAVAGGTKNMQAGTYSIRIVPVRQATGGYNNPSNKVSVTIATDDKIRVTFPAMDTTAGQDAWDVYGTLYSGSGIQGPWYLIERVTTGNVAAAGAGTYDFEWSDAELAGNTLLSFNNDPPPDAGFVSSLQGYPILLSCNGQGRVLGGTVSTTSGSAAVTGSSTTFTSDLAIGQAVYIGGKFYEVLSITSDTAMTLATNAVDTASGRTITLADTAPGPVIRPSKPNNIEAFPAELRVAVSPPENIIGYVEGNGRLFCMTENRLHMVTLSGNSVSPITTRPFWRAGFKNSQGLVFVNGRLYGYTAYGPTRSIADGDEGAMEFDWAADVANEFQNFIPERVRVAYDPVNEAICYFHSNDAVNGGGYYQTKVLMYMLRYGVWSPPIVINDDTANMTVVGVATISGQLYFVANEKIYKWHAGSATVTGYIATPFVDMGADGLDKTIRSIELTGYSTSSMAAGVWAASSQETIPVIDIQNGTNSDSGSLTFAMSTAGGGDNSPVRQTELKRINVRRARLLAVRVSLASASPNIGRLDEVYLDWTLRRNRY